MSEVKLRDTDALRDAAALLLGNVEDWIAALEGTTALGEGMAIRYRALLHIYEQLMQDNPNTAPSERDVAVLLKLGKLVHTAGFCPCEHKSLALDIVNAN